MLRQCEAALTYLSISGVYLVHVAHRQWVILSTWFLCNMSSWS